MIPCQSITDYTSHQNEFMRSDDESRTWIITSQKLRLSSCNSSRDDGKNPQFVTFGRWRGIPLHPLTAGNELVLEDLTKIRIPDTLSLAFRCPLHIRGLVYAWLILERSNACQEFGFCFGPFARNNRVEHGVADPSIG